MIIEAPEGRTTTPTFSRFETRSTALNRAFGAAAFAMMLVCIWALMHRYRGLTGDAELYAFQALARILPGLGRDLSVSLGSQDAYTIFSPLYAVVIHLWGLRPAGAVLTGLFTAWFLAAAWFLARQLTNRDLAWICVAALVIIVGRYGAFGVFHSLEVFLTARSAAEALVLTALACHYAGHGRLALATTAVAFLVHPIMTLPGLLLLLCLRVTTRVALLAAAGGILLALLIGLASRWTSPATPVLSHMDSAWLEVVRERSQFLFLQLWTFGDWKLNSRTFVSLIFAALVIEDPRIRRLCWSAILVAVAGLIVGLIAGSVGPAAILLQGQAWRWIWIATVLSLLFTPLMIRSLLTDPKCGPLCAMMVICSWTFTPVDPLAAIVLPLLLWLVRSHVSKDMSRFLFWVACALALIAVAWILGNAWTIVTSPSPESGREPAFAAYLRNILGLDISAVLLFWLFWLWMRRPARTWLRAGVAAGLTIVAVVVVPSVFRELGLPADPRQYEEFADWRSAIPPGRNVFIAPTSNAAGFTWFTLERPSYLSIDQSAGVVFSRATALEVKRRSDVVLPVQDAAWRIQSKLAKAKLPAAEPAKSPADATKPPVDPSIRPLTAPALTAMCRDPQMDFIVAKELVGFDPLRHDHAGPYKNWYLYDCRHVRALSPIA